MVPSISNHHHFSIHHFYFSRPTKNLIIFISTTLFLINNFSSSPFFSHRVCDSIRTMSPAVRASSHIWFFCNSKISNWSSSGTTTGRPIVRMVVEATSWTNDANLRVQRNKCWRILKQWHKANFRWIGSIRLCVSSAPTPFFLYSPNEVYLLLSEKHEIDFCYRSERESFKRETNWQEKKVFAKKGQLFRLFETVPMVWIAWDRINETIEFQYHVEIANFKSNTPKEIRIPLFHFYVV